MKGGHGKDTYPFLDLGDIGKRFSRLAQVAVPKDGVWRELYDLKEDPGEKENILASDPGVARDPERKLNAWIRRCGYAPLPSRMKPKRH